MMEILWLKIKTFYNNNNNYRWTNLVSGLIVGRVRHSLGEFGPKTWSWSEPETCWLRMRLMHLWFVILKCSNMFLKLIFLYNYMIYRCVVWIMNHVKVWLRQDIFRKGNIVMSLFRIRIELEIHLEGYIDSTSTLESLSENYEVVKVNEGSYGWFWKLKDNWSIRLYEFIFSYEST